MSLEVVGESNSGDLANASTVTTVFGGDCWDLARLNVVGGVFRMIVISK